MQEHYTVKEKKYESSIPKLFFNNMEMKVAIKCSGVALA